MKLSHRRLPCEVHIMAPAGEFVCYVLGSAEARGAELAAESLGLSTSVVVLVPEGMQ
jgi:hypothetical protein